MNIYEYRFSKILETMNEKSLDALYISSAENYQYICGFDNPDGYLFVTKKAVYEFADGRYIEAAKEQSFAEVRVYLPNNPPVSDIVAAEGVKSIGIEDGTLSCAGFEGLKKRLSGYDIEYKPLGDALTWVRSYKTDDEVENILKAQHIAEGAFDHIINTITYDMTEIEVAAELEYYMKKHGSVKPSFDTICVSGTNSSRPHGVPRPVKLEKGFLTMDYGALWNGYHSDMTRTIVIGKADDEMKKLYNTVLKAQQAGIDAVTEGAKNFDCDKAARDIIDSTEFKGYFTHSLGHGVGLVIHELPGLSQKSGDLTLKAGQIVTVEPGIYIEGKYGCRIEDMVLVTKGGKQSLTNCPKELIEI